MFGIGRKVISPEDFGVSVIQSTKDELGNCARRSLALQFDGAGLSRGSVPHLESNGITADQLLLYVMMFTHCSIQGAARVLPRRNANSVVSGAMSRIAEPGLGYDRESLSQDLMAQYSANEDVETAAVNAVYLIENFVDPILPNSDLFWDDIENYISQVEVGITVAERAMRHTLGSYRVE
tara:strand:- start:536 stop:1075 length:540 start_codon:yes stop_codon:yes gene_type:complete